jgi:hypothetical protein
VIIYELVCLRRPFPASSIGQLAMAISINEPEALPESTLGDDIRQLVRLLMSSDDLLMSSDCLLMRG